MQTNARIGENRKNSVASSRNQLGPLLNNKMEPIGLAKAKELLEWAKEERNRALRVRAPTDDEYFIYRVLFAQDDFMQWRIRIVGRHEGIRHDSFEDMLAWVATCFLVQETTTTTP